MCALLKYRHARAGDPSVATAPLFAQYLNQLFYEMPESVHCAKDLLEVAKVDCETTQKKHSYCTIPPASLNKGFYECRLMWQMALSRAVSEAYGNVATICPVLLAIIAALLTRIWSADVKRRKAEESRVEATLSRFRETDFIELVEDMARRVVADEIGARAGQS